MGTRFTASRFARLLGAGATATALGACFLMPDKANLRVETDQPEYVRGPSPAPVVITMRNAGGETALLSGTDHIRIDIEFFDDGRWNFDRCLGCLGQQPPSEVSLEVEPGETHTETVEVGSLWQTGHYRIVVPYRSAGSPRTTRRAYSRDFEVR
jgi:hypothetical protein